MTQDQILVLAVLGAAMALFVQGRWRHDVVAFAALLTATVLGLVPSGEAFDGFGHPAVFTVAAILVVSRALQVSGALDGIAGRVAALGDRPVRQAAALTALATGLSAFMNNVGALALVMPIAMSTARKSGRPVSLFLMPIAFGACLGGLTTLIGTPPNLILSQYRESLTGEPFGMFSFTPIGLPLALVGLGFLAACAPRLLPTDRAGDDPSKRGFEVGRYVTELVVVHDAPVIGKTLRELLGPDAAELDVLGLVRSEVPVQDSVEDLPLRPGDVLRIRADSEVFTQLAQRSGLRIGSHVDRPAGEGSHVEAIVPPGSRLEGRTPGSLRLHSRLGVHLLAVARQGKPPRERLADVSLRPGDVLLLRGERARLAEVCQTYGTLPLAERSLATTLPRRRSVPAWIFGAAVGLTALGMVPVQVAFGIALVALVASHSITIRQLYETVDWSVIVLLAAMIPLGEALQTTGVTESLAQGIAGWAVGSEPAFAVGLLLVATTLLTNVINNAATAVVMAPLAASVASQLGCHPDAFLMAVAVGASSAFATPIGHQNNVLVMGPGGYRFGDYVRLGVPLTVVVLVTALPTLLWIWPPVRS